MKKKCEKCGTEGFENNPVTSGPDPFEYEINGDDTPRLLCEMCRQMSREAI
jgi:hypothetical protein